MQIPSVCSASSGGGNNVEDAVLLTLEFVDMRRDYTEPPNAEKQN